MAWPTTVLLGLGGATAIVVSCAILATPTAFYSASGIDVQGANGLLNELKVPVLVILLAGVLQIVAIGRPEKTRLALGAGTLLYLGFGLSRLLSMAMYGLPSPSLIGAAGFEMLLGLLFVIAYWRHARSPAG